MWERINQNENELTKMSTNWPNEDELTEEKFMSTNWSKNEYEFTKVRIDLRTNWLRTVMINLHWLEQPMSRTNLHGPKDVRAIG